MGDLAQNFRRSDITKSYKHITKRNKEILGKKRDRGIADASKLFIIPRPQFYIAIFIINIISKNIPSAINGYLSNMIISR